MSAAPFSLVLYNGATGGIGRHLGTAASAAALVPRPLVSRLEDPAGLRMELEAAERPELVHFIHLAARVSVPACESDPRGARELNVVRAAEALDIVIGWALRIGVRLRVTLVSTGHVYAAPGEGSRTPEDAPTAPRSVYAATKLEAEAEFAERTARAEVPLVIARVFGVMAPGQPANYVLPGLIRRVRLGLLTEIPGLDMTRDYLDARDVCRDLLALTTTTSEDASDPIVNVCSGRPTTIRAVLRAVLAADGHPDPAGAAANAVAAPGRTDDVRWLVGDPTRFVRRTGRNPQTLGLDATVRDALAATP